MRRLRNWRALLAAAATAVALTVALAPASPAWAAGTSANFWIACPFNGVSATIDPIVSPGSTATAHFHDFFGATGINANSTPESLQAAGLSATSCTTSTDTAAYWAPTLLLHPGETQTYAPSGHGCTADPALPGYQVCHYQDIRAYYGNSGASGSTPGYQPNPFGEEVVGGDSAATGVQPVTRVSWSCGGSTSFQSHPYDCTPYINPGADQDGVILRVIMPRCWNGADPHNRANFAYPTGGINSLTCPAGFTGHLLPFVNVRFHTGIVTPCPGQTCTAGNTMTPAFGFEKADGTELPWYTAHGDFMDGWQYGDHLSDQRHGGLDDLEQDCLIGATTCPVNPHTGPSSNNMPT